MKNHEAVFPTNWLNMPETKLTPLFKQYLLIKKEHPDCILMYRLGDFYEMFGPDAQEASQKLGIVLTARQITEGVKVPMCGVPHHSLMRYVKKLVEAGYKVALCDQLEEPDPRKKLVARGVTRIITAGTLVEDEFLSEDSEVFLMTLAEYRGNIGVCILEASGGKVGFLEFRGRGTKGKKSETFNKIIEEIKRIKPQEILIDEALISIKAISEFFQEHPFLVKHTFKKEISENDASFFIRKYLGTEFLESYELKDNSATQLTLYYLFKFLREVFKVENPKLFFHRIYPDKKLILDELAVRHLELFGLMEAGSNIPNELQRGLYGILDSTLTPMGKRLLKRRLREPFAERETIEAYLTFIEELTKTESLRKGLREILRNLPDSERIMNRILLNRSNPAELARLKKTLAIVPRLKDILSALSSKSLSAKLLHSLPESGKLLSLISTAINDEPPLNIADGGVIREGYNAELDRLRQVIHEGELWFKNYEEKEKNNTGIRTLKVKRTEAFGWFIEVTKASTHLVPSNYERRQTLVGAERYVTNELRERELEIESAKERALEIEKALFDAILEQVKVEAETLHSITEVIAELDYVLSLAETAIREGWTKAEISTSGILEIKEGVHPLVLKTIGKQKFVPNDCYLDGTNVQINVITGPNMGGKSTYMRMVAILAILAHMGSFVPAKSARVSVLDRIYTRIGATDALSSGKSTFMVEMVETASILNSATDKSLVILDEIGHGTSTYDGISIARAVIEYIHEGKIGRPKTLFATHYFELTELSEILPRVRNLKVDVRNIDGELVFLYKVLPGFVDESYGVEVAKLAGLPEDVVKRARAILNELEEIRRMSLAKARQVIQLGLFKESKV